MVVRLYAYEDGESGSQTWGTLCHRICTSNGPLAYHHCYQHLLHRCYHQDADLERLGKVYQNQNQIMVLLGGQRVVYSQCGHY